MAPEIPNPKVVVLRGGQVMAEHELPPDGEVVIGRTGQCQVTIPDSTVSRMHARLYADGQAVYLEDLGSANGTFVDGERVMGAVRLADGQVVRPGQKSLATPIVLRFEDPAKRLLEEMGLLGSREPTPPPEPAASRAAESPTMPVSSVSPPPPPTAEVEPESPPEEEPPPPPPRRIWPLLAVVAVIGLVALGGFLWWAARMLKPSSARWETVQLSSHEVSPGTELVLQSSEIQAGEPLRVLFAEEPVAGAEVLPGRLRFVVPELTDRAAGSYPVPLSVRDGDLEVFGATLSYTIRPQLDAVTPLEVRVGETVTITGKALPDVPRQIEVLIGTERAQIVEATPARLVVRVPLVTRDNAVQVPIAIRSGDWEARAAATLTVLPRQPQPLDFAVSAQYREAQRVWELVSPLGPLFVLHGPAPGAGGEVPGNVREVQERLRELFTLAAEDPALRVEVVTTEGRYQLRAVSPRTRPWPIVDWTEADLAATANARRLETTPDLLAFWMAKVWNHLLTTFARGEKPPPVPDAPAYLPVLARLVDANVAAGGSGRPEAADLEALTLPDRAALADAFFTVPAGQGTVAGKWTVRLENLFYPEDDYVIELQLDLAQRGRALSGSGVIFIQSSAMTMRVPQTSVNGNVQPGLPSQLKLRMSFARPIGNLELTGVFEGGTLQGTYSSSLLKRDGSWQGVR
jgi:hypothetical protein